MSNSDYYLLSPTRILPSMTPHSCSTITTTRSWPLCDISLSWQCLHSGEWYPSSVSAIPHPMCFLRTTHQNRHSPYVTFNTIRSVNITTMKQDLWMICNCSINNQQENDLFVINLSKEILLVIYAAFKRHSSIIFQRIPSVSWILSSHLINIIQQSIQNHQALISSSYHLFAIGIPPWHIPLHSINIHFLFPFHMISIPLIQTHSHSQPLKHTPTASILASLCNPWF